MVGPTELDGKILEDVGTLDSFEGAAVLEMTEGVGEIEDEFITMADDEMLIMDDGASDAALEKDGETDELITISDDDTTIVEIESIIADVECTICVDAIDG